MLAQAKKQVEMLLFELVKVYLVALVTFELGHWMANREVTELPAH
jgi:hypothetical protein